MMIKNYLYLSAIILIFAFQNNALAQEEDNKALAATYLELGEQIYQEQGAAIEIARDNLCRPQILTRIILEPILWRESYILRR